MITSNESKFAHKILALRKIQLNINKKMHAGKFKIPIHLANSKDVYPYQRNSSKDWSFVSDNAFEFDTQSIIKTVLIGNPNG